MKTRLFLIAGGSVIGAGSLGAQAPLIPGNPFHVHDEKRPQPRLIETVGAVQVKPPSDAIVLFDGKNGDAWASVKGGESPWEVRDGVMVAKMPTSAQSRNLVPSSSILNGVCLRIGR